MSENSSETYRVIYFSPLPDGTRERRCLTLDRDRTLLSDAPAPLAPHARTIPSPEHEIMLSAQTRQEQDLRARGVTFTRQPNGELWIEHVPAREQLINQVFLDDGPCEFPGCVELRTRYWQDVQEVRSSLADPDCPTFTCAEARLAREYRRLAEEALRA